PYRPTVRLTSYFLLRTESPETYALSLHDALPISRRDGWHLRQRRLSLAGECRPPSAGSGAGTGSLGAGMGRRGDRLPPPRRHRRPARRTVDAGPRPLSRRGSRRLSRQPAGGGHEDRDALLQVRPAPPGDDPSMGRGRRRGTRGGPAVVGCALAGEAVAGT